MLKNISFILIFTFMFSACNSEDSKFGRSDTDTPEHAAIQFFEHIYHHKTIDGAIEVSTPKMARLLRSYHTNKGAQKNVLNMRFDTVALKPKTRNAGRSEFATETKIAMFFVGELDGKIIKDLRDVKLIKVNKKWQVDEVSLQ